MSDQSHTSTTTTVPDASINDRRRQQVVLAIGRQALAPPDLSQLLRDAAKMLAETMQLPIYVTARPSSTMGQLDTSYHRTETSGTSWSPIARSLDAAAEASLCGWAINVGEPVVISDLETESRLTDDLLLGEGVRSAIACPMVVKDRRYGALAVCATAPREFSQDDVMFVETISHLLTTSMAQEEAEAALQEKQQFTDAVLSTIDGLVVVLDAEGRITDLNRKSQETLGFASSDLYDRYIWSAFLVPEDVTPVRSVFSQLRRDRTPIELETYVLTKHGDRGRVAWTFSARCNASDEIETIIATGIDVTEHRETDERLALAREETRLTQKSLDDLVEQIDQLEIEGLDLSEFVSDKPKSGVLGQQYDEHELGRRQRSRMAYPYKQRIAPFSGNGVPPEEEFREVKCRDISVGGFSYLAAMKPAYKQVIVALGIAPNQIFLSAEIVHTTPIVYDGRVMYAAGCRYLGRMAGPQQAV
jgi:PAS domain S-box-containing protein